MKKKVEKILPITIVCVVAAVVFIIGFFYFRSVSDQIYNDSTNQLKETYQIVGHSVRTYIEQKWRLLEDWDDTIAEPDFDFDKRKEEWLYTELYFLASDEDSDGLKYVTHDGNEGTLYLEGNRDELLGGNNILAADKTELGRKIIVFAIPVKRKEFVYTHEGEQKSFGFDALAIGYTNEAIASALNTNPYQGNAQCFVLHNDGKFLFSTEGGNGIYGSGNYLDYLKGEKRNVDKNIISQIERELLENKENLITCDIDGTSYCIFYQPLKYQDLFIFSVVPQATISSGFLSVQRNTTIVFVSIFSLVGLTVISLLLLRFYKQSRQNITELKYREQMFDVLSNSVNDIFIMFDPETQKVDYISPNIEKLLGISVEDAKKNVRLIANCAINYNIVIPKEELYSLPENGDKHWECEYMHQKTGERRWYRVTIYNMNIRDVKKCISVMTDRTLEQNMNNRLLEAFNAAKSANEAKSNFLSNMSHDIRTPMNAIVGFSMLLEKDADKADKVREYTRKIMASGHHLLSLINDVLDMSKIESGKTSLNVERFSLPELLDDLNIIIAPQAKAKNQTFTMHVTGAPPEQLTGDKLRLNQILINLLSNAIKYTPAGGKIEFIVGDIPQPSPQYAKLRFTVRDNGIGMSEEFQKQVFAPFSREINSVTNSIQGTGLGMAITKNLVDLMGGIISVESAPGKGSTFIVEISFLLPQQEEQDSWFRHKITRMLVADDEEEICLTIKEMMRDTGVDVSYVTNGFDAVDHTVKAIERGENYHVILLDWKMPDMDGVETARKIREKVGKDVPILVLTSYDWSDIETEAREAGINAFMPKPFFTSTFWQTIKPLFIENIETPVYEPIENGIMDGKLFLVVEDNELNAEIFTEMLAMEGAKSELAVNGKEGLEKFLASKPGYYDLILMDVQMPVMNGYEATRAIRASSHPDAKTIPIVAMTANTFAEDVRNALDAGMNAHLAKPINMEAVRETIGKLLKDKENG